MAFEYSLVNNAGGAIKLVGKEVRTASALSTGALNYVIRATENGWYRDFPGTVTVSSGGVAPTAITLEGMNGQPVDGHTVETWRGRDVLRATANAPGCRIEVVSGSYRSQGLVGSPHIISPLDIVMPAIGTVRNVRLRAVNASGSYEKTFNLVVKPFVPSVANGCFAFWDYCDPALLTYEASNGRLRSAVDTINGFIRESPDGYANTPGTKAPVFDSATKRLKFTPSSQQYLKLAPDAKNDPLRAFLNTPKPAMAHVVFFSTATPLVQQGLVDWRNTDSTVNSGSRLTFRLSSSNQNITVLRMDDAGATATNPSATQQGLFSGAVPENFNNVQANVPTYAAFITNGLKMVGHHDNRGMQTPVNDLQNGVTTINELELGRAFGSSYFNGIIYGELIANIDICPSVIRGIYATKKASWGLPDLTEPEMFSFDNVETDPFYSTGYEGIQLNPTFETDFVKPTGWVYQIGDRTNKSGVTPSNPDESAYHPDPRYPGAENLNNIEKTSDGRLWLRFRPRATANLSADLATYIAGLSSGKYKHVGSAISTRRFVAPGPTHAVELYAKNPPNIGGNFACYGWTLSDGGGHPPETDWLEQRGDQRVSHGLHQNSRWPWMATRQVAGASGGMPRSWTDKETHSYQFVFDAVTDTIKYYQDGFLFSTQRPLRGLRLNTVKALKDNLIAGNGRGSNILADNGTTTGALRVCLAGGGLPSTDRGKGAKFAVKIEGGQATDIYWDAQSDSVSTGVETTATPGSYLVSETVDPLVLLRANLNAIQFSGGSGTLFDISMVQIGVNDPVVPEGYHLAQYLIANNAAGGPGNFTGTASDDRFSEGYVSRVDMYHMRRAPVVVSSATATAANTHCTNLFSAIAAQGVAVASDDQNMIYNLVSKAMSMDLVGLSKPMDGSEPIMDYTAHRTLWDSVGMIGFMVGPYNGLVDWKDPSNVFVVAGGPQRTSALGYIFDGRSGGGQYIDTKKLLTAIPQFGPWAQTLTGVITRNDMTGTMAKAPIMGAGSTLNLRLGGPNLKRSLSLFDRTTALNLDVPDTFSNQMSTSVSLVTEAGRVPITSGIVSFVKREQSVVAWKDGNRTVPFLSGYYAARDMTVGHAPGTVPASSLKLGSEGVAVQGAAACVGGFALSRYWSDEEHAAWVALMKPLYNKYAPSILI